MEIQAMNKRQKKLLRLLMQRGKEFQTMDELAKTLDCSEKTVRNDLQQVEVILQEYPQTTLVRKQGIGVYLDITAEEEAQLFRTLFAAEPRTAEERTIQMAYQLLSSKQFLTLQHLAERFYTNQAAIRKDLETIADWLEDFGLTLVSKQRVGSGVNGSELNKRNALAHLSELVSPSEERNYILDLFPDHEITVVRKQIKELASQYEVVFPADGIESMLVHTLIMIRRVRQHATMVLDQMDKEIRSTKSFAMTEELLNKIEKQLQVTFPESERIYYTWHVLSMMKQEEDQAAFSRFDASIQEYTDQLILKLQELTSEPFQQDTALRDGLLVHLQVSITRLSYGLTIKNPLRSEIKKMYPYMFSMLVLALEDGTKKWNLTIPEDEAAYLVLHFQAAMERLEKQTDMKKQVVIVCHMGVGMSRLLQAKIEQQYTGMNILDCIGQENAYSYLTEYNADFIISTVKLEQISIPSVVVSPLLEASDKARLNQFLNSYEGKGAATKTSFPLAPLLDPQCIFVPVTQTHRYEVVELMARALREKGFVKQNFIHRVMWRERASATAIGGGIALPHTQPESVKQSVVAVAVMDKPLEWGNEFVSIVFMLAITSGKQNLLRDVMQHISAISEDPAFVLKLKQAADTQEVQKLLSGKPQI